MKKQILMAAVSALALGALVTGAKADPVMYNWSGLYVGVHAGYAFGDASGSNSASDGFDGFDQGSALTLNPNPDGALVGITSGYNWQRGELVYGIESETGYIVAEDSATIGDDFGNVEYGYYSTLAARLGMAQNNYLIYGKGGIAFADTDETYSDLDGGVIDANDVTNSSDIKTGWVAGFGIEWAMQRNWSLKLEYSFMDFGSETTTNLDGDLFTLDNQIQTVKVGANFKL